MNDPMDGLAALDAKRTRVGRRLPPPRNAPRTQPVVAPAPAPTPATVEAPPVVELPLTPKPVAPVQQPAPKVAEAKPLQVEAQPLEKASIYLDPQSDEFLESARIAGRRSKPRVDASRSAVVRLALARLAEQMTPDQVVRELVLRAPAHTGEGRRRY
ncbi:hypothetical protein [Rhodococcus sp. BH5]|uniref:hypothetical protein n=1 Tax=Rhodococcus sp. BH5 TaxID=2871702 RepID=UPI0022CD8FCC|nr:hypothetical protein [Rhodococcus sp. BH5]MCZ9635090.1 hypothetical protein [Rhodococcus sp. BH5]